MHDTSRYYKHFIFHHIPDISSSSPPSSLSCQMPSELPWEMLFEQAKDAAPNPDLAQQQSNSNCSGWWSKRQREPCLRWCVMLDHNLFICKLAHLMNQVKRIETLKIMQGFRFEIISGYGSCNVPSLYMFLMWFQCFKTSHLFCPILFHQPGTLLNLPRKFFF